MQYTSKHFYRTQDANQPAWKQEGPVIFCEECQQADTNALNETHLKISDDDLLSLKDPLPCNKLLCAAERNWATGGILSQCITL